MLGSGGVPEENRICFWPGFLFGWILWTEMVGDETMGCRTAEKGEFAFRLGWRGDHSGKVHSELGLERWQEVTGGTCDQELTELLGAAAAAAAAAAAGKPLTGALTPFAPLWLWKVVEPKATYEVGLQAQDVPTPLTIRILGWNMPSWSPLS